jgi:hypothetical protein
MDIKILNNIVEKIILPEYTWIKDYNWTSYVGDNELGETVKNYYLEITVDKAFDFNSPDFNEKTTKLFNDVEMLFKMTGPPHNVVFADIIVEHE